MRPLTFSDDKDNEQEWLPGGIQSAADAFLEFVAQHRRADNTSFAMEDEVGEEALLFMVDIGAICRVKGWQDSHTEYRIVTNSGLHRTLAAEFARGGFAALDLHGPWLPDVESFLQARSAHLEQRAAHGAPRGGAERERGRDERGEELRSEFDRSVLRQTHPRELRRRLEVLTRIDGREPVTVSGVTHYGYAADGTVNAWFAANGRGLVLTFDRSSALGSTKDTRAHAALYDGVPADLLALVRDVPATGTTLNVPHPDGGTLVAATGIFTFSGPCAMADGLATRLQGDGLGIESTGVGRLLERFLAVRDFTPAVVAEAGEWWSPEDIAKGFAATPAPDGEQAAPLDREALTSFCKIWADSGYNDRWDVHYVLFDSRTLEEAGPARDDLLELVRTLGLERVDTPRGAATGEVWVRTDPRVDVELGNWS
ncbi:DUF6357 family protein [Lentzea albidocapillata]|uniref:Uncharacterized protein n=1 Tax=Lentzea albidocapillata TaxID=40571 RepID=A0A1W1ZLV8_9PSEU|nr:DUF6357 family protein [Lentzea albidocapillata]SMC49021.1 hypothetical protein SAMN05660733_00072 [Lentzea albidocapillata]